MNERTVADDLRDFGNAFEVDGKRIDPSRVTVFRSPYKSPDRVPPFGYLGVRELETMRTFGHAQVLSRPLPELGIKFPCYLMAPPIDAPDSKR